jgi:DNA-binding transcriptional LysR family regulator
MDSTTLHTFLTVARLGSFTEAAENLYLSQSAVSKRVAALESELNSRLLDRLGKRVLLTEAGKVLAARAQSLLMEIEDTRREIFNLSTQACGQLSVGTSHHVGLHRLPVILQNYTSRFPAVELDLHFMNSEQICDAIKSGELELGIITLPLQPVEHLASQVVWNDGLEFVISRRHSLMKTPATSRIKDGLVQSRLENLADHAAILPSRGTFTRAIVDNLFSAHELSLTTKMETNYLETIKMLVGVGLGWSVLPRTMLDNEVLVLQIPNVHISRKLGAVWHSSRTLSNAAQELLNELEKNRDL